MSPSSRIFRTLFLALLITTSATLSGCGFKVAKQAPDVLLREPKTSYLLSADTKEVSLPTLFSDCLNTTIQAETLILWAR